MPELSERCLNLWKSMGVVGDPRIPFADLQARYSQPWRAYHTLAHIEAMFAEFDQVRHLANDPTAIEFAIWYHDAVYDPGSKLNEENSASLFDIATMMILMNKQDLVEKVKRMILATKHSVANNDYDTQLLCDIDFSILGQPEKVFDEYEKQIREEYDWVSEQDFIKVRSAILQSFLDRPRIYSTEFFQEKYEEQARKNLARSIEQLSRRLQP